MRITYDKKRKDITFCTMLFKIPQQQNLNKLKHMDRKFENFYLPSLEKLIRTFGQVALWCDKETAEYIKRAKLDKYVNMRVLDFQDLPHYSEREEWLKFLHEMRKYRGFLLHHKTPEEWIDYMILIAAKPAVMDWAARHDKFNSEYFMWIDAGSFNSIYAGFWENWTGHIEAYPQRCRITIAPTLGKTRPRGVPKFIYNIYKKCQEPIKNATAETLVHQNLTDIAMINADYDVPASSFIIPKKIVHKFYNQFETVRKIMKRHHLVSTEQAVFQAMMKFDINDLFEVCYIRGYTGVYAAVAKASPDHLL